MIPAALPRPDFNIHRDIPHFFRRPLSLLIVESLC